MSGERSALDRLSAMFAQGRGGSAIMLLPELLRCQDDSLVPKLSAAIATVLAQRELGLRAFADLRRANHLDRSAVLASANSLAQVGFHDSALAMLDLVYQQDDPSVAVERAQWAMKLGDYARTVAETECAIATMIRSRSSVDEFIARACGGESPNLLLLFERSDVARLPRLRKPLVLRWEALRRLGERQRAEAVRDMCLRYWPERISVWEAAGQHALEDADFDRAERYFDRALALDQGSLVALAGYAIVLETKKDWQRALELRRRVAEVTGAWQGSDAASLHRVIRFAANLCRLDRWAEAAPHLRRAVCAGAFAQLPIERPVLLRVFTHELYAPALIANMLTAAPELLSGSHVLQFTLRDAELLRRTAREIALETALPLPSRAQALGMCAWLLGNVEDAQRWFGQAHALEPVDPANVYLKLAVADASTEAAQVAFQSLASSAPRPPAPESNFYLALIARRANQRWLPVTTDDDPLFAALLRATASHADLFEHAPARHRSYDRELAAALEHMPRYQPESALDCVRYWTAVREAYASAGFQTGVPARLSAISRWRSPQVESQGR